jgi:hypothetical protein
MMNPIEQTPQTDHDGRPKRRRLDAPSPADTPAINRIVPSFNRSPDAASVLNQPPENHPTTEPPHDDDDSFADRPITQDPSLLPPPPSPPAVLAAVKSAAAVVGPTFVPAPNELTPLEDIPPQEIDIIKRAISEFYHIDEPRDFQIQAIHYLAFHDNPSLVLLRRTADGKSLVPLTTSILRCGNMCSACLKETEAFTGTFYCKQIITILTNTLLNKPNVGPDSVRNAFKLSKRKIFHPGHVPGNNTSPIHALLLQLVARNILKISVGDPSVVGTHRITKKHLIIQLSNGLDDDGVAKPAYLIDRFWNGMTFDDNTEPESQTL